MATVDCPSCNRHSSDKNSLTINGRKWENVCQSCSNQFAHIARVVGSFPGITAHVLTQNGVYNDVLFDVPAWKAIEIKGFPLQIGALVAGERP